VKGSSITNFHSSWGKETYLKAKKCSKFRRCALLDDRMFKLILHATAKVFVNRFCSHFNTHGFTSRSKSWIQLWSNNVHYHFCFLSPKSCFKQCSPEAPEGQHFCVSSTVLYSKLTWKHSNSHVFTVVVGRKTLHQKGLRTLYSLIFHSEAT